MFFLSHGISNKIRGQVNEEVTYCQFFIYTNELTDISLMPNIILFENIKFF